MSKQHFMTLSFFLTLAFGFLLGRRMSTFSMLGASYTGLLLSFVCMFVGMILTHMHLYAKIHNSEVQKDKAVDDKRQEFEKRIKSLVKRQKTLHDGVIVDLVKAMTQKVSNRILARHFDGLSEESKRVELFKDVDAIIEEEIVEMESHLDTTDE